jgi:hypothetical protein
LEARRNLAGIAGGLSLSGSVLLEGWVVQTSDDFLHRVLANSTATFRIHAFEVLAETLHHELDEGRHLLVNDEPSSARKSNGQPALAHGFVPSISIGAFRLAMPKKAFAEINLQLAAQTVQHVKTCMHQYATRMGAAQTSGSAGSYSTEESSESACTIMDLAEIALYELRMREQTLLANLRATTL